MKIAGLGFRSAAPESALAQAIALTGHRPDALATAEGKAQAPQIKALAATLGLPLITVPEGDLANQPVLTHSPRVAARFGTGSLAEAAALAATGPQARLLGPRVQTQDGMATAAIAEGSLT